MQRAAIGTAVSALVIAGCSQSNTAVVARRPSAGPSTRTIARPSRSANTTSANASTPASGSTSATPPGPVPHSTYYTLVQYPQAGFGGIHQQTLAARHSIDMEIYELADPAEEADLAAAAARHVRVRVLLDSAFTGRRVNQPAYDFLRRHGVQVRWAPAGVIFHLKATTFDDTTTDVSTANLTSRYYATSRDAEIIDRNPTQVHAIETTFDHDWAAGPGAQPATDTVQAPGLVWSPDTGDTSAQTALVSEIDAARHSVDFESEELSDPAIYDALTGDARRGVSCKVTMTDSSDWDTAYTAVTAAGCRVHVYPDNATGLYIYEKLILDDPGTSHASLLIGSQNASDYSLTRNRELGLLLTNRQAPRVISAVAATFASDYTGASPWTSRTPPTPSTSTGRPPAQGSGTSPGTGGSCTPLTDSGHCYTVGEYCRDDDHGTEGTTADGEPIVCTNDGGWRWEPR